MTHPPRHKLTLKRGPDITLADEAEGWPDAPYDYEFWVGRCSCGWAYPVNPPEVTTGWTYPTDTSTSEEVANRWGEHLLRKLNHPQDGGS